MDKFVTLLQSALRKNNYHFPLSVTEQLAYYLELLLTWNKVFNLTSITQPKEMVNLHILDSLSVLPFIENSSRVLDVGSGAGLPGIPLAIIRPELSVTTIDKNNKKTRFMTQATAELKLNNVTVVHAQTTDFHPSQCFDGIISRAFGSLKFFVESCAHLLTENGMLIAMKGKYPTQELAEVPNGFAVEKIIPITIQGVHQQRHIVCLKRER